MAAADSADPIARVPIENLAHDRAIIALVLTPVVAMVLSFPTR